MKILFICGSIEPGCDGVGDYTWRLAVDLSNKGHQVSIIGLYDNKITDVLKGRQYFEETGISYIRFPYGFNDFFRFKLAGDFIANFNPDWISIQYVIFAFHNKGLPFYLNDRLKGITSGHKVHIMFHELWLGLERDVSLKYFFWGLIQRHIMKSLLLKIKPSVIHTHTKLYKAHLEELGFKSKFLPIYSNIPLYKSKEIGHSETRDTRLNENQFNLIVFGYISPDVQIVPFISEIVSYQNANSAIIHITFIGLNGKELSNWVSLIDEAGITYTVLGPKSPEEISEAIARADYGISTTLLAKIEKSGSVAAVLEHGLPVINISRPNKFRVKFDLTLDEGIFEYKEGNLKDIFNKRMKYAIKDKLAHTSQIFINDLEAN